MATIRRYGDVQWQAKVHRKACPQAGRAITIKKRAEYRRASGIAKKMDDATFVPRHEARNTSLTKALERYLNKATPPGKGACQAYPRTDRFAATIRGYAFTVYRNVRLAEGKSSIPGNTEFVVICHSSTITYKKCGIKCLRDPMPTSISRGYRQASAGVSIGEKK